MSDSQMSVAWAHSVSVFAGVMLIVGSGFQAFEAQAAIVDDDYLVVLPDHSYVFDLTAWGWIHLLICLALAAIGVCLLTGQGWALAAGIVVAGLAALPKIRVPAALRDSRDRDRRRGDLVARLGSPAGEESLVQHRFGFDEGHRSWRTTARRIPERGWSA